MIHRGYWSSVANRSVQRYQRRDWKSSVVLPIYNGKGDPVECSSYRGIKLLEHAMKVVEGVFERIIRQHIEIDDMQFGFMKGKGMSSADAGEI